MRSKSISGKRNEIAFVDGLRLGSRTRSALLQSTYSVESWLSQNCRSSASSRNCGSDLTFLLIAASFPPMHRARRDDPNHCVAAAQRESDMQKTPGVAMTQCVKTGFALAMPYILDDE